MRNYIEREETEIIKGTFTPLESYETECVLLIKDTETYFVSDCHNKVTGEHTLVTNSLKSNAKLMDIGTHETKNLINSILDRGFSVVAKS